MTTLGDLRCVVISLEFMNIHVRCQHTNSYGLVNGIRDLDFTSCVTCIYSGCQKVYFLGHPTGIAQHGLTQDFLK